MGSFAVRTGRFFGAGLMLLLLQLLALSAVGLAAGYFHHRVELLLEPLTSACGGHDPVARMQVAEHLLARVEALDDWQPLIWVMGTAVLLALLGALLVCVHWLRRVDARCRTSAWGLLALHLLALGLATWMLRLYEQVWAGVVTLLPIQCMVEEEGRDRSAWQPGTRWLQQMFIDAGLPLPQAPDALAIVLCGTLLAGMVVGIWLWRASPLPPAT